ncbi:LytTR family DNA-binding domain-containing protein [Hymenobacter sp.]|uniref:LytR/AlgR family response regulator transcription factor n=1 Tax=Hymenobacter sp. TaxID=1898978 RepID=UPI00286D477F|nr:LytTR family DNA-binding domain-containing protein [Hymenobacter sp.]
MLPIQGRQAWGVRAVAIPVLAVLAAHVVLYQRFPGQAGYQFPWPATGLIAAITLACWETNLAAYRYLDRRLPFQRRPVRRLGWQALLGSAATAVTFGVIFLLFTYWRSGSWPAAADFGLGLLIAFTLSALINAGYVGLYLLGALAAQRRATATELAARRAERQARPAPAPAAPAMAAARPAPAGLLIECGSQVQQLAFDDIAYFYSAGGLVRLVRADGGSLTTSYDSLAALTDRLPAGQFFQINRQYLVNLRAVRTVQDDVNRKLRLTLTPGPLAGQPTETVLISRYRSAEFRRWLQGAA